MAKYTVTVEFTQKRTKEINVYARSDEEAQEKAENIVLGWDDVTDAEAVDVQEE